jgi:hypothetical protein
MKQTRLRERLFLLPPLLPQQDNLYRPQHHRDLHCSAPELIPFLRPPISLVPSPPPTLPSPPLNLDVLRPKRPSNLRHPFLNRSQLDSRLSKCEGEVHDRPDACFARVVVDVVEIEKLLCTFDAARCGGGKEDREGELKGVVVQED